MVSRKLSNSEDSFSQFPSSIQPKIDNIGRKLNYLTGYQNRLQFWTKLPNHSNESQGFDVHHFHLIENGWFNLEVLFESEKKFPTIWTWHDLWPITGHCIHPQSCERWLSGCGNCPELGRPFSVKLDKTRQQVAWKEKKYKESKFLIHVSTSWMKEQILKRMPFLEERIVVIPFGIEEPVIKASKSDLRLKFGYSDEKKIILIRGASGAYKNISSVVKVFKKFPKIAEKLHLIDIDSSGFFKEIGFASLREFNFIDREKVFEFMKIADLLILPSSAETFGVIGVEAQLSGVPVLYQSGTACEEVLGGKSTAIPFNGFDSTNEIGAILVKLIEGSDDFIKIGIEGQRHSRRKYSPNLYVSEMIQIYSHLQKSF